MAKEVEDIEFDELMAEKRHRELKGILTAVKSLLEKPSDTSTTAAIEKMASDLTKLLSEQKPLPITVNSPDVNVQVSTKDFVSSVEQLSKDLLEELRKFNSRPIPSQFDIEHNYGNLKTVKIVYSTADKLNYKK